MDQMTRLGWKVFHPTIRSSDLKIAADPFRYLLKRRLGISGRTDSSALIRGTIFHSILETWDHKNPDHVPPDSIKQEQIRDVVQTARREKLHSDTRMKMEDERVRDFEMMRALFSVAVRTPLNVNGRLMTPADLFSQLKVLAHEFTIRDSWNGIPIGVQADSLLFDAQRGYLWINDAKTCSEAPSLRLTSCPCEFQTQIYSWVVKRAMPCLIERFHLPSDTSFGGMIHWAVRKPQIRLKQDETPQGYHNRVREWAMGEGAYKKDKKAREAEPITNLSFTYANDLLEEPLRSQLQGRLRLLGDLATRDANLENYPAGDNPLIDWGRLSPYAGFYLTPPEQWKDVLEQDRLVVRPREEGLPQADLDLTEECEVVEGDRR